MLRAALGRTPAASCAAHGAGCANQWRNVCLVAGSRSRSLARRSSTAVQQSGHHARRKHPASAIISATSCAVQGQRSSPLRDQRASITDSACKNQLVVVSVQYGPFNPYITIRSTTIGKSRVVTDPIAMHTSWRSNSDITSVTRVSMAFRVVRTNQYNQDLGPIHSTNGAAFEQEWKCEKLFVRSFLVKPVPCISPASVSPWVSCSCDSSSESPAGRNSAVDGTRVNAVISWNQRLRMREFRVNSCWFGKPVVEVKRRRFDKSKRFVRVFRIEQAARDFCEKLARGLLIANSAVVVELERKSAATQIQQRRKFSCDANSAEETSSSPRRFRIQVPRQETRFLNRELRPRNSEGTLTRTSQISCCNGQIELLVASSIFASTSAVSTTDCPNN
ncbi:hypothetical protein F511_38854 [Dorcoceras hygrometricum]|uniref:Uncharacterized protein n=1 Tax=Dorcoceras hygrometricum TaxID=472368 RepID=A0A2Z7BB87_9LAMI|nr:hypothetical protein F511_38854 [Dorcoceras hygrometricum]